MKLFLKGILVVEGKEDASYLSNYIDSEIVILNGYEMDERTINYLENKTVIALLDPDEAGHTIRKELNKRILNVINVEVDIKKCTKGKKTGIAECEINEIINALKPYAIDKVLNESDIKQSDLFNLNLLSNKNLRNYVCDKLGLGKCNGKKMYQRLVSSHIQLNELKKIVSEYNGN